MRLFQLRRMLPTTQSHLQHTLEGIQCRDQERDTLCSGETGRTGPQLLRHFQEKIYEPGFLCLLILREALKSLTQIPVPHDLQQHSTKTGAWLQGPLDKITALLTASLQLSGPAPQSRREAASQAVGARRVYTHTTVHAQLCPTLKPWTVAHKAPPPLGFPRQEYWRGLPFPTPGDLPDPGIQPTSPAMSG